MGPFLGGRGGARVVGGRGKVLWLLASLAGCGVPGTQAGQEAAALAASAFEAGNYEAARDAARQAVGARDDVAEYWLILGRSELELAQFENALDAFQRAQELDRSNPEALRALAELSVLAKRPKEAEDYVQQSLALNPRDPRALIARGLLTLERGDHQAAGRIADDVIKRDPRFVGALALKAKALVAAGEPVEGARILENAMRVHGQSEPLLEALLDIYQRSGNGPEERRTYARLVAIAPQNQSLQLDFARALYRRGDRAAAFEQILRLHRASPDDSSLPGKIANLWLELGSVPAGLREIRLLAESDAPAGKVAMARYAAETRWPGEAVRLLAPLVPAEPSYRGAGAAALLAEALLDIGRAAEAGALAERVLALDATSPRALAVTTRIALDRRKLNDALAGGLLLTSEYPRVSRYRALLARIHLARGELNLADQVLKAASRDFPKSAPVLQAHVALLERQGSRARARDLTDAFTSRNRDSAEGWALRSDLCRRAGDNLCLSESLARLDQITRRSAA